MAENTGILLIAGRIGSYFTEFNIIAVKAGLTSTIPCSQSRYFFTDSSVFRARPSFTPMPAITLITLGFDKYFSFFVLFGSYFTTKIVICPEEPIAIPAMFVHVFNHILDVFSSLGGIRFLT